MALGFFFSNTREQRKDGCVNVIILRAGCDVNNEAKIFRLPSPDSNLPSKAKLLNVTSTKNQSLWC